MPSKNARIAELEETIERQAQTIKRLEERLCELELELARAKKDSSTSSKPPSSDIVNPPKPKKKRGRPKKRRKGGQPATSADSGSHYHRNVLMKRSSTHSMVRKWHGMDLC